MKKYIILVVTCFLVLFTLLLVKSSVVKADIASNLFFQLEDRVGFAKEVARILKSTGRLLFIDWSDSFGGIGPASESVVKPAEAKAFFEKNGFMIERNLPVGSHHYGLIIRKK